MDLKDWLSYDGTIEKREFIIRVLIGIAVSILLFWIPVVGQLAALAITVVLTFAAIRRHRGLHMNPWLTLVLFIPIVGFFYLIYIMVKD